jgi:riboflavin kinase/FMN adenylyltransferase
MQVIQGVRNLVTPFTSSILTVGNFDGVHLGHRELLNRVTARAKAAKVPSVVMTFEPHPVKVLYPDRRLHRIFDFEDQRQQLEAAGIDALVVEPFSREFSQLTPDRYLQEWIYRPFSPLALIVGYDFNFGVGRQGSIELLRERAKEMGFQVEVVSPVKILSKNGEEVLASSTRIRQALEAGDVALVQRLLGRAFYVRGIVEKGAGRGRTIGIPTANLRTSAEILPARGVYCAWAWVRGQRYKAMVNIGLNPTFRPTFNSNANPNEYPPLSVEAHILDFPPIDQNNQSGDIYGENVKLEFVARLREEKKFSSVDELVAQIRRDITHGAEILDGV